MTSRHEASPLIKTGQSDFPQLSLEQMRSIHTGSVAKFRFLKERPRCHATKSDLLVEETKIAHVLHHLLLKDAQTCVHNKIQCCVRVDIFNNL
jgi:hypothetical protein